MDQILPLGPQKEPILFTLWLQTSNTQSCEKINPCYFQAPSLCYFITNIQEINISPHLRGCDTGVSSLLSFYFDQPFLIFSVDSPYGFRSLKVGVSQGVAPGLVFLLNVLLYILSSTPVQLQSTYWWLPNFCLLSTLSFIPRCSTGYLQLHLDNSKPF